MRVIICNTPKGQFQIPIRPVAEHRADYYACEVDGYEKGSEKWEEEVQYAINDSYEAIDWILNETDWENWKNIAIKINDNVNVTDDSFWASSDDFEIKEVD
jgi:hypothetical protein